MRNFVAKYYRQFLWAIFFLQLALLAISIPKQAMHIDEAWQGEQAYYLAHDSVVRSETFQGFLDSDQNILVYHKAFIWMGCLLIKLFGFGLFDLRLLSIISGTILLGMIYLFCRKNYGSTVFLFAAVVLLSCPLFFRHFKLFRPELFCVLAGFVSFYFLISFLNSGRSQHLIGAGLAAGFSVLIHLNGLIFVGAGIIILLSEKRWKTMLVFTGLAVIVAAFYFVNVLNNFALFKQQLLQNPSNATIKISWLAPFENLLEEHKRLFRNPAVIGIVVLFLLSLLQEFRKRFKANRALYIYIFSLIIILGIIGHNKTAKYAILLMPFMALMIALNLYQILHDSRSRRSPLQIIFLIILVPYLGYGLGYSVQNAFCGKENLAQKNHAIAGHLEKDAKVLAPLSFIFDEIDNFDIMGLSAAKIIMQENGKPFGGETLCEYAQDHQVKFIILDKDFRGFFGCRPDMDSCLDCGQFRLLTVESDCLIYVRR